MDGLSDEERVKAWLAAWHISLDGWAIVDGDLMFRSVNPQWMQMLGVLPSEFIGRSFKDITEPHILKKDLENAELTKRGIISSYKIHKTYQFSDGETKKVVLLVVRVPIEGNKPFSFYLSRILLADESDEKKALEELKSKLSTPPTLDNGFWMSIIAFLSKNGIMLFTLGLVLAGVIAGAINEIFDLGLLP